MRKTFPGYYRPTEDEFSELWNNCLFVLDANVLLNLYRYSQETREELLGILDEISDRLWVPHQSALEYHQNRLDVIGQQASAYSDIQKGLRAAQRKLENDLRSSAGRRRHPFIKADRLLERISGVFAEIEEELNALEQEHPDLLDEDPIRDSITALLEGKVGSAYSSERMNEIYKEGKTRYEHKIPPGYSDVKKEGTRKYGDLVLWFQTVDKAEETRKPMILVTDDRKDDWWLRFKEETIGPQPGLVGEMVSKAGVSFYMYAADPFMGHARKYLERQVEQEAINEVRDVRKLDEEYMRAVTAGAALLPTNTLVAMRAMMEQEDAREFRLRAMMEAEEDLWREEMMRAEYERPTRLRAIMEAEDVREFRLRAMMEAEDVREARLRAIMEAGATPRVIEEAARFPGKAMEGIEEESNMSNEQPDTGTESAPGIPLA